MAPFDFVNITFILYKIHRIHIITGIISFAIIIQIPVLK